MLDLENSIMEINPNEQCDPKPRGRFHLLSPHPIPDNWHLVGVSAEIPCRSKARTKEDYLPGSVLEAKTTLARQPRRWTYFEVRHPGDGNEHRPGLVGPPSIVGGMAGFWRGVVLGRWLQWRPGKNMPMPLPVGSPVEMIPGFLRRPQVSVMAPYEGMQAGVSSGLVWWRGHRVPLDILLERGWGDPQPGDLEVSQDERDVVRLYLEIWAQHGDGEAHNYLRSMREGDLFGRERPPARTVEEKVAHEAAEAVKGGPPVLTPVCQGEDGLGRQEHHFCKPVSNQALLCCFCGAATDRNLLEQKVMQYHEKAQSVVQSDGTVVVRKKRMQVRDYGANASTRQSPRGPVSCSVHGPCCPDQHGCNVISPTTSVPPGLPVPLSTPNRVVADRVVADRVVADRVVADRVVVGPKVNTKLYTLEED